MRKLWPSLALLLLLPEAAHALQNLPEGAYTIASTHPASVEGAIEAQGSGGQASWIRPGARLTPTQVRVFATSNANDAFTLDIRYPRIGSECAQGLLSLAGTARVSGSWGGDDTACSLNFLLSPTEAQLAATAFHTVRQDRHPLGERLTATFTTPHRRVRSGADVEIAVVLANPADAPLVRWQRGGANRGPRDDQFDFTVTRDGQPLTNIEAMNFGGLSQFLPLAPGAASETLRVPLASWVDLSARGHYVVQCRYHTVFLPEGVEPYGEGTMGAFWDRTFEGTVTFDVR